MYYPLYYKISSLLSHSMVQCVCLSKLANISVASDIFVNQLVYQCWLQYLVNSVTQSQ